MQLKSTGHADGTPEILEHSVPVLKVLRHLKLTTNDIPERLKKTRTNVTQKSTGSNNQSQG